MKKSCIDLFQKLQKWNKMGVFGNPVNFYKRFFGLFSATFEQIRRFSGHRFFPAKNNFLGPVLSYLAEKSAIWQQCIL
jgi:hypothetical protein